jgi:NADH dehydrogenase (ubiquinone) 1 alpha subcomplex subunit 13
MPQDMPPVGGYSPVQYKRNLPARGFRPAVYLIGTGVLMTYGFWRVGQGIREHKYVYMDLQAQITAYEEVQDRTDESQRTRAREDVGADTPYPRAAG